MQRHTWNDLSWSRSLGDYLLGKRQQITDLVAWNADATRVPYRAVANG
jgi:polyhydroxyalkanoate synthase